MAPNSGPIPPPPPPSQPGAPAPEPGPPPVKAFDESILHGREFLLEPTRYLPPLVQDTDLGPLETNHQILQVIEDIAADAADGALEPRRIDPRWGPYLQAWAQRYKALSSVGKPRVGRAIEGADGELSVPVGIRSKNGSSFLGWMALSPVENSWVLSDVQLVETAPRTAPFDPETSGQEISSPSRR